MMSETELRVNWHLHAIKLAGEPNTPVRFEDEATAGELHKEFLRHLSILIEGGVIDLETLPAPNRRKPN
jgi:hypothetical protein